MVVIQFLKVLFLLAAAQELDLIIQLLATAGLAAAAEVEVLALLCLGLALAGKVLMAALDH
jgi:hypothetical protein